MTSAERSSPACRALNQTRNTTLCERLATAKSLFARGRGLLGRSHLESGEGLLIRAGRVSPFMWMHTFFMRFPIDVVFVDQAGNVLRVDAHLKPWRFSSLVFGAARAIEVGAGAAQRSITRVGDRIVLEPSRTI